MELKTRIIEESSLLFFQHGIKSMTMSDIASHLGISKRTLYEVFGDKDELLAACIERSSENADREIKELIEYSGNVIDAMMRIYAKHLSDMHKMNRSVIHDLRKYHPRIYKLIECKQKDDTKFFIPLFEKGVGQGLLRDDVNFEIVIWLVKAQFKAVMDGDFIPTEKYSIEEFVGVIILNFMRGIATVKGNELIDEMVRELKDKRNKYL